MSKERGDSEQTRIASVEGLVVGYDEMNLAEFPLASVSDRFLDGSKTVVFEDTAWDRSRKERVPRKLTISGSDQYGLPTAKDDDVLLACVQISSLGNFSTREVHFSRYELLKLLRWKDETRNYRRVAASMRRWLGLSVYSNRAFFDKGRESWVNKDFGVFDNLFIYERESEEGCGAPASSWFIWNEVLFESFQSGYLKRIDWDLYCRLESPVAKRLYRFLDKRFYHGNRVEIDLHELAIRKVRLSPNYNVAQMKRALQRGIEELEAKWELKHLEPRHRFAKHGRGQWSVHLERKRRRAKPVRDVQVVEADASDLVVELSKRSVGPAIAEELVTRASVNDVRAAIELHDWYNARSQERGPGFLVNCIRNPADVRLPKGFESSAAMKARRRAEVSRNRAERELSSRQAAKRLAAERAREKPFRDFWDALDAERQEAFESAAVNAADPTKRQCYFRAMGQDEGLFNTYRGLILRDYFERDREKGK